MEHSTNACDDAWIDNWKKKNVNGCIVNQIVGAFKGVCVMANHVDEHIILYMWRMDQMWK
jgi:hypothetical protein